MTGPPPRPWSATWPGSATGDRRIGGFPRYWHSRLRTDALAQVAAAAGIEAVSVAADYTAEHGAEATQDLLKRADPPTAILYDNDVMAVAGLGAAQRMGIRLPADLSIVTWDDSALCELVHPALTALRRDIPAAGASAARMLSEVVAGRPPQAIWPSPRRYSSAGTALGRRPLPYHLDPPGKPLHRLSSSSPEAAAVPACCRHTAQSISPAEVADLPASQRPGRSGSRSGRNPPATPVPATSPVTGPGPR